MLDTGSLLTQVRASLMHGDKARALSVLQEIITNKPSLAEAWFLRGAIFHGLGELSEARDNLKEAARLDPKHEQSRFALAAVCLELNEISTALSVCREALSVTPDNAQAWFSLGVVQERATDIVEALFCYERVLALNPKHEGALKNRLGLHRKSERLDDAIKSAKDYVAAYPFSVDAQCALGESCLAACANAQAVAAFDRAIRLSPKNAHVSLHAGFALAMCERFVEAQACLDQAKILDKDLVNDYRASIFNEPKKPSTEGLDARTLFLLRHYDRIECCDWRDHVYFLQRFSELISERSDGHELAERALGFRAMAMGVDPRLQRLLATKIAAVYKTPCPLVVAGGRPKSKSRLRIGYVSPDFRMHPIGLMTEKLYGWHDRARFEIYCYALGGDDGSDIHLRIKGECDRYICLDEVSDAQAAKSIADDAIDILVDLAGYTENSRPAIFGLRPAPIQISWLGYAATMGAPWIDYLVADDFCIPSQNEAHFSESVIRMPAGQYLCSYANRTLEEPPSRVDAGLPEQALVLAAMHNPYKIDPEIFTIWMRVLRRHPESVLWLLDTGNRALSNLKVAADREGVDPRRLVFAPKMPHAAHLNRLQLADLVLDTSRCNGSTTICDALVAGVPVVTCKGATFAQRMAASVLVAAESAQWVATTLDEYEAMINSLLCSPGLRVTTQQEILNAKSRALFFRPHDWVRYLEDGYEIAWQRHIDGLAPSSIEVQM